MKKRVSASAVLQNNLETSPGTSPLLSAMSCVGACERRHSNTSPGLVWFTLACRTAITQLYLNSVNLLKGLWAPICLIWHWTLENQAVYAFRSVYWIFRSLGRGEEGSWLCLLFLALRFGGWGEVIFRKLHLEFIHNSWGMKYVDYTYRFTMALSVATGRKLVINARRRKWHRRIW